MTDASLAAASTRGPAPAATSAAAPAVPPIGLGCATLMQASLPEQIEAAARHGFGTITVRPASFAAALAQGIDERALRRRLRDAGVRVRMIDAMTGCLPGRSTLDPDDPDQNHFPPETFFPPEEEICLRAAEVLEAPFVNVTCFAQEPVPIEPTIAGVAAICRRAGARGLRIALEFIPGTSIPDLATADAIARSCGEPNCGVTLDPWHWSRSGGTVDDVRALPPHAFAGMQLCDRIPAGTDTPYRPMSGRLLPGEGVLPLAELTQAVFTNSPAITIEAEIIDAAVHAMPVDDAAAHVAAGIAAWRARVNAQAGGDSI